MIVITIVFLIGVFFEKSDYHLKKEADKLPSFTKKEAEDYYNQTFNQNNN
jgi:hypothetical protein